MKIKISRKASKGLGAIRKNTRENTYKFLEELEKSCPAPEGWKVKKIGENEYRAYLDYRHRIRYVVLDHIINITYIGTREGAYKGR